MQVPYLEPKIETTDIMVIVPPPLLTPIRVPLNSAYSENIPVPAVNHVAVPHSTQFPHVTRGLVRHERLLTVVAAVTMTPAVLVAVYAILKVL